MKKIIPLIFIIVLIISCAPAGESENDNTESPENYSTAINTIIIESGDECPNGGIGIESGIDENGNGILDDNEIDSIDYVCNGSDGTDGANGSNGNDNSIVSSITCSGYNPPTWYYYAVVTSSGDVFASASIGQYSWANIYAISGSKFFPGSSADAELAFVPVYLDLAGSGYNDGWFEVGADRETGIVYLVRHDIDVVPNPVTYIQTPDKCEIIFY